MLLTALPILQSLFLKTLAHLAVQVIACAEEFKEIVLCVALPQTANQFITLICVQVR